MLTKNVVEVLKLVIGDGIESGEIYHLTRNERVALFLDSRGWQVSWTGLYFLCEKGDRSCIQ